MKIRVHEDNINTKEYFEKQYADPNWRRGWDGADVRLSQAMELIKKEFKKHLDIGCADGTFTKYYLEKFPNTKGWGVDISEVVVEHAKKNCPLGHFKPADCYSLPFKDEEFDLVHCAEMIEHVDYPEKAIDEMYRVLKKNGTLIITTPNEKADDYIEHLWKWDTYGVRQTLGTHMDKDKLKDRFKIIEEYPSFHNGHIMYVVAIKL
jgi:ubiquinone/menaquinone biosynthesis C-methylase UbiE